MEHRGWVMEHKRFGVPGSGSPETRSLTRFRRAVSKSNAQDFSCWCSWSKSSELIKCKKSKKDYFRAFDKMRKLAGTYFSSDKKRLGSLRWWTFGEEPGVFIRSLSWGCCLMGVDVTCYSAVPLRLFCRKVLTVRFWKSLRIPACLKSEQKATTLLAFLAQFLGRWPLGLPGGR